MVVNHSEKGANRFKRGMASTNNAKNIFSIVKRSIKGTYRKVTDPYLQNYLNEFAFRFNHRNESDYGFSVLLGELSS
ncbi:MAG: transposase [Bacteroidetes bacterium]|nr:transposase [Bacteroidota bacterium]